MTTWNDLKAYIGLKYKVAEDNGNLLKLIFDVDGGRSQIVLVAQSDTGGGLRFATIASPFGKVGQVDPVAALSELSGWVVGGAVVYGDLWMVRHAIPLDDFQTSEFEVPLHLVLTAADALEAQFVGSDDF